MSLAYYGSPEFDDRVFEDTFIGDAEARNQRIADLKAELIAEALAGKGDFWPGKVRESDGAIEGPEWDLDQGNVLLAALRDSFIAADPAGAQLRYAKAIHETIADYAQRRAEEEIDER